MKEDNMDKNLNGYPTPPWPVEDLSENESDKKNAFQLAMVYAPIQDYRHMYTPEIALARGTLFSKLDKPLVLGGKKP